MVGSSRAAIARRSTESCIGNGHHEIIEATAIHKTVARTKQPDMACHGLAMKLATRKCNPRISAQLVEIELQWVPRGVPSGTIGPRSSLRTHPLETIASEGGPSGPPQKLSLIHISEPTRPY